MTPTGSDGVRIRPTPSGAFLVLTGFGRFPGPARLFGYSSLWRVWVAIVSSSWSSVCLLVRFVCWLQKQTGTWVGSRGRTEERSPSSFFYQACLGDRHDDDLSPLRNSAAPGDSGSPDRTETFSATDSRVFPPSPLLSLLYPSIHHESGPAQGFFLFKGACCRFWVPEP